MKRFAMLLLATLFLALSGAVATEASLTHLDLSKMRKYNDLEQVLSALEPYPDLESVVFGNVVLRKNVLDGIRQKYPDLQLEYYFTLCGKKLRSTAETVRLYGEFKFKTFDAFVEELSYFPNLKEVTAFHITFTFEQLELLSERYPGLKINCRVHLGGPTIRTDATAFSTKHAYYSTRYNEHDFRGIKYCEELLAFDVGHNAVKDLDFLKYAPQLRILILADNRIEDISPIAQLKDLEYLELFKNPISDVSPLVELPKLFDLNMTFCDISDISPLLQMRGLKRLYLTENPIEEEDKQRLREHFPECDINFDDNEAPTAGGWRQGHKRYLEIVQIFEKSRYRPFRYLGV